MTIYSKISLLYFITVAVTTLCLLTLKFLFDTPKPVQVAKRLIQSICKNDDILIDFFAGSCTAAHALMLLNAEDGANRRFIMVQLPEECDEKSEAKNLDTQ